MAVTLQWLIPQLGIRSYSGLSGDAKPTGTAANSEFFETDTLNKFIFDGASWIQIQANGSTQTADGSLATKITTSGGYTYIGEALPGTAQATAAWRCQRIDSTGSTLWADGNGSFDNAATDLTALSYS